MNLFLQGTQSAPQEWASRRRGTPRTGTRLCAPSLRFRSRAHKSDPNRGRRYRGPCRNEHTDLFPGATRSERKRSAQRGRSPPMSTRRQSQASGQPLWCRAGTDSRTPVQHWNNRRRPTAVCGDFVRFIPLLDGRSLMAVESLPGRAYRLFPQSGRATRRPIGRRWSRPRQPSLENGRASSQKAATKLRDLSDSGAHAGPFHFWPPRDALKSLGACSLECAFVRSRAPSNTALSGKAGLQRLPAKRAHQPALGSAFGFVDSSFLTDLSFELGRRPVAQRRV